MADLISREAVLSKLEERFESHRKRSQRNIGSGFVEVYKEWAAMAMGVAECLDVVRKLPAVDAVEVVRCKDCDVPHNKWTGCPMLNGLVTPPDFYCGFGERREENAGKTD